MLNRWFTTYAHWILRHRGTVLVAVLAASALLTCAAGRLRIEVDPDKQVPEGHPYIDTLQDLHEIFGDKNLVVVALVPRDGRVFTPRFLRKLDEITARLSALPGANPNLVQSITAPHMKDVRGTRDSIEVRALMEEAPVDQAAADEIRRRVFANDAFVGTLVSADGKAAAIQASFELTPATPEYRSLHQAIVRELEAARDGSFEYELTGLVILLSELSRYSARIAFVFPLALLVIALMHFDAFRTLQGLLLPLVTALLSVLWAIGLMGAFGIPLDPLNTTTPVLILAVAAGHAVQVLKRFYEEYAKRDDVDDAIVSCIGHIGPVMVAAGAVAILSFWSLMAFHTPSIRTFGAFAGLGIFSALVVEMTIIPVVRSWLPAPKRREQERQARRHPLFDPMLRWAATLAAGRRVPASVAIVGLVGVALVFAQRVEVRTSLLEKFRRTDRIRMDHQTINSRFSGTSTLIALVEGTGDGAMEEPRIVRAIDGLERMLEDQPGVGKAYSYVDALKRLHRAATADDPDATAIPDTRELVAQYLLLYSLSGGGDSLDAVLEPTHRLAKVRVLARNDDTAFGDSLIAKAEAFVKQRFPPGYRVRFTGTLASTSAATQAMVKDKLANIVQMAAMTVLVSSLLLHSIVGGCLVALPLIVTVIVSFGVMGLLGVPLDTMTAAIAAMAVGIGADYAMYFLFRAREEARAGLALEEAVAAAIRTSGKAILFVSSAVASGYATLALTGFSMHVSLGLLVALAMLVSAASTVVVVPMLVVWWRPAFIRGYVEHASGATGAMRVAGSHAAAPWHHAATTAQPPAVAETFRVNLVFGEVARFDDDGALDDGAERPGDPPQHSTRSPV